MPLPGKYDITDLWIGNTFEVGLIIKSDANTPLNLAGSTLIFRCVAAGASGVIRKSTADPKVYWSGDNSTLLSGFAITNPAAGECLLALSEVETRRLSKTVPYEIEIRRQGKQTTVLQGNIITKGGINDDV